MPAIRHLLADTDSNVPPPITNRTQSKRKAEELDIESDDERLQYITESCDVVRRKIRAFIESGEMKIGEFQRALGVSANAYGRFMKENGRDKGSGCDTYREAYKFFKKRQLQGIKPPTKKKVKKGEERNDDLADIHLDGESATSVPVFDSCDEIRKKIRAYLALPGVTQAAFLREAAKTYPDGRKIQSKVLNDFLGKKGASAGNTSSVFYSSYVFFEKLRIKQGKSKSKHRLEMEKVHPGGMDTDRRLDRVWCRDDERPYEDKYGKIHIGRF